MSDRRQMKEKKRGWERRLWINSGGWIIDYMDGYDMDCDADSGRIDGNV